MLTLICVIVGCIITIIAAFADYNSKLDDSKEQLELEQKRNAEYKTIIEKSNNILTNSNTLIESQKTVIDTAAEIIKLQNELSEKNNIIQKLQNETFENLTGGKGVPRLRIFAFGSKIFANIINDTKYPIKNVEVTVEKMVHDYLIPSPDGNGGSTSNPDAYSEYLISIGDMQNKKSKRLMDVSFIKEYFDYYYIFRVTWQNGYYTGGFHFKKGDDGLPIITDNHITIYSEGLDLNHKMSVNDKFARVIPYHPNDDKLY